jgi:Holliday junction resolvase RusA-like endonuclease
MTERGWHAWTHEKRERVRRDALGLGCTLTVRGPLRGKGRPRFVKATGRTYTPKETVKAELRIRAAARAERVEPLNGPVRVHVIAVGGVPKSWSKRKREEALAAHFDMRKPDGDNVLKLVLDALNGVAWHDDVQVVDARVERRLDAGGERLVISIERARNSG